MKNNLLKIGWIGILFLSCQKEPVVAVVNEHPIYLKEVVVKIKELPIRKMTPETIQRLFYEQLDELIEREVVITSFPEIARSIPDKEVEKEVFKEYSKETVQKFLKDQGLSYNEWLYTHKRDVLALLILERLFEKENKEEIEGESINVKNEEVLPYVEILHILTTRKEDIEEAQELIKKGTPFEEVAKEFSIAPEGKEGGRLGPFFPGEFPPEFDICFKMNKGEVSDILHSPYGYHIFKVVKKGKMKRSERMKNSERKIREMERKEEFSKHLIGELMEKANVKRYKIPFEKIKW